MNKKRRQQISFIALVISGGFFLLCAFLFARMGDFAGSLIFAVPAQVLWTGACVDSILTRKEAKGEESN